jgi:hypothetical protein
LRAFYLKKNYRSNLGASGSEINITTVLKTGDRGKKKPAAIKTRRMVSLSTTVNLPITAQTKCKSFST